MNGAAAMDPRDAELPDPLPANLEAEQGLLAAILARNESYDQVADRLRPEHFADGAHGRIFEACGEMIVGGKTANAITLKGRFEADESLADVGGVKYLAELQNNALSFSNAADYGQTILDAWLRRQIIDVTEYALEEARRGDYQSGASGLLDDLGTELAVLQEAGAGEAPGRSLADLMDAWLANVEEARRSGGVLGVPTGLALLDEKIGGLHKGNLVVIAGRPGQGKTSLALTIAQNAAEAGTPTLVLSIEMSDAQLTGRLLAGESGVSVDTMLRGKHSDTDAADLVEARARLHGLPLVIESPRHSTVQACRSKARRMKRRGGLGLVVIDYLQLMVGAGRQDNRVNEISQITRELKKMAEDLMAPVVLLSQLNREVEKRDDKRPQLSDLRDSGSIEQDADVVMFVYREIEYLKNERPRKRPRQSEVDALDEENRWRTRMTEIKDRAEVLIRKNRHGPTGDCHLFFDAKRTRFGDHMGHAQGELPIDGEVML